MTELDTYTVDHTTVNIIDPNVSAYALTKGDQVIIEGDLCVIRYLDDDREDIDEILVKVENLSGERDEFVLYADDTYALWAI